MEQKKCGLFSGLPDKLILDISLFCSVESVGRLSQVCHFLSTLLIDDVTWKRRISVELTVVPKLIFSDLYRKNYEIMYDFKRPSSDGRPSVLNDSNYKSFLIMLAQRHNKTAEYVEGYSLESYLESACALGADIWVKKLLSIGANVNTIQSGYTPLMIAVRFNHIHLFEVLLGNQADVNLYDSQSFMDKTTFFHCILTSSDVLKCMSEIAVITKKNKYRLNLDGKSISRLSVAILNNDIKRLQELLLQQRSRKKFDIAGFSPLAWAILLQRVECLALLHRAGADINEVIGLSEMNNNRGAFGYASGLFLAIHFQKMNSLKFILSNYRESIRGICIKNGWDGYFQEYTPIELAVKIKCLEAVKILIYYGVMNGIREACSMAASIGHVEILQLIVTNLVSVNFTTEVTEKQRKSCDIYTDTPLSLASKAGHTNCIHFLLFKRADPNVSSSHEESNFPSHKGKNSPEATTFVHTSSSLLNAIDYLLGIGKIKESYSSIKTRVKSSTFFQDLEYYRSIDKCNEQVNEEFCKVDYNPGDAKNLLSYSALENIRALLKAEANVNFENSKKQTALSLLLGAERKGNDTISTNRNKLVISATELLLRNGAVLTIEQFHSKLVSNNTSLEMIRVLIEIGRADIDAFDSNHLSVIDLAKKSGNQEVVDYFHQRQPTTLAK